MLSKPTYAQGATATIIIIDVNQPDLGLANGCKFSNAKLFPKNEPKNISNTTITIATQK